jgi:hypothetical protein
MSLQAPRFTGSYSSAHCPGAHGLMASCAQGLMLTGSLAHQLFSSWAHRHTDPWAHGFHMGSCSCSCIVCLKSNVTFKIFLHNAFYHFPLDLKMYTFVYLKPVLSMYFSCGLHLCTLCTHVLAVVQSAASTLCLLLYDKITIWAKQSSGPRQ